MRTSLATLALALAAANAHAQDKTGPFVVHLEDGSMFAGKIAADTKLTIRTPYGEQQVPLDAVLSLRRVDATTCSVRTASATIEGTVTPPEFIVDSPFGKVTVAVKDVKYLAPGSAVSGLSDDHTVALWSFDDVRGSTVTDAVGGRPLVAHEATFYTRDNGATVFRRNSETSYAEAAWSGETGFTSGSFTLESRFKIGRITKGYATILAKNEKAVTHNRDFWLLVQNGGQIYLDSGTMNSSNFVSQSARGVNMNDWTYLAVVRDKPAGEFRYFVNGKLIHTDKREVTFNTSDGPVFLGPGAAGAQHFSCPEQIQFARISRVARTADDIAECHKMFEAGGSVLWRGRDAGFSLRSGGFMVARCTSLEGRTFKTAFGSLKIGAATAARLQPFRFREADIRKIEDTIAGHIRDLGAETLDEREVARTKLIEAGEPAIPLLRKAREGAEATVRVLIDDVINKLEASGVASRPPCDVLVMGNAVLYGWIDTDSVDVETQYGKFTLDLRTVGMLNLARGGAREAGRLVQLADGQRVEVLAGSGALAIDTGFGELSVPLADITAMTLDTAAKRWTVQTLKLSTSGMLKTQALEVETGLGKLTVPIESVSGMRSWDAPPKATDEKPAPQPQPQPPQKDRSVDD